MFVFSFRMYQLTNGSAIYNEHELATARSRRKTNTPQTWHGGVCDEEVLHRRDFSVIERPVPDPTGRLTRRAVHESRALIGC